MEHRRLSLWQTHTPFVGGSSDRGRSRCEECGRSTIGVERSHGYLKPPTQPFATRSDGRLTRELMPALCRGVVFQWVARSRVVAWPRPPRGCVCVAVEPVCDASRLAFPREARVPSSTALARRGDRLRCRGTDKELLASTFSRPRFPACMCTCELHHRCRAGRTCRCYVCMCLVKDGMCFCFGRTSNFGCLSVPLMNGHRAVAPERARGGGVSARFRSFPVPGSRFLSVGAAIAIHPCCMGTSEPIRTPPVIKDVAASPAPPRLAVPRCLVEGGLKWRLRH